MRNLARHQRALDSMDIEGIHGMYASLSESERSEIAGRLHSTVTWSEALDRYLQRISEAPSGMNFLWRYSLMYTRRGAVLFHGATTATTTTTTFPRVSSFGSAEGLLLDDHPVRLFVLCGRPQCTVRPPLPRPRPISRPNLCLQDQIGGRGSETIREDPKVFRTRSSDRANVYQNES